MFTGLSRDYPGIVPGLSRPFPEISWEFCLCVSLFPQEKEKHINNLTPIHFRDNPAKLFMFIGFFAPRILATSALGNICHRAQKKTKSVVYTLKTQEKLWIRYPALRSKPQRWIP